MTDQDAALVARLHSAAMYTNDGDAGRSLQNEAAARIEALTTERDGAVTRGQMMLDAKNKYVVRATAAEAALAERDKLLVAIESQVNSLWYELSDETGAALKAVLAAQEKGK